MLSFVAIAGLATAQDENTPTPTTLLTDPFLQLPTNNSIHVVWFTEFSGTKHFVSVGSTQFTAHTTKLSRMFEDERSRVSEQTEDGQIYQTTTVRDIWRHEAEVTGLHQGERRNYRVTSIREDGKRIRSEKFTLAPLPAAGQPLKILLTSDHQLKAMTPANLQKVAETIGRVDAVFFAGDLVNIPDRASEWFDDNRGFAFFPSLQGRAMHTLERSQARNGISYTSQVTYRGGELIQHAPLFPVVGNHEVMGRFDPSTTTSDQYNDPHPRLIAEQRYEQLDSIVNPFNNPAVRQQWIQDNSYNTITYEELFTLPNNGPSGERYYGIRYGDVYMIGLYATRIWRTPSLEASARGKYREPEADLNKPDNWGYGDFIFEDLAVGSEQYNWLVEQLNSEAFKNAPYKVVVMHQGPHGIGDNYNPVFAHPEQIIDYDDEGRIVGVRYEYPIEADILISDIEPLLNQADVQLVHQGHSHLWFHLQNTAGVHYLETSNVGNSFGCYLEGYKERENVPDDPRYDSANYVSTGDPHGLSPIPPSILAPQQDDMGNELPCIDSNELTAFSILDTQTGTVKSYVFDTRNPESAVVKFDEFPLTTE
jgi:hypothetical protein